MSAGSTNNTKDSAGRRLGVKKLGGMEVFPGDILVRQRGMKWHAGENTYVGKDHTIHSKVEGVVYFSRIQQNFHRGSTSVIHVKGQDIPNRYVLPPRPHNYHPELFPHLAEYNWQPLSYSWYKKAERKSQIRKASYQVTNQNQREQVDSTKVHQMRQAQVEIEECSLSLGQFSQQYLDRLDNTLLLSTRNENRKEEIE